MKQILLAPYNMGECTVSSSWFEAMRLKLPCELSSKEFPALIDAKFTQRSKAKEKKEHVTTYSDLNYMQRSDDSPREALRITMLNQEELFEKQVSELHRLYWIQKNLMKNIGTKEPNGFNYVRECSESMLGSLSHMKNKHVKMEKTRLVFPELIQEPLRYCSREERKMQDKSCSRLQQSFIDLELLAPCVQNIEKDFLTNWNSQKSAEIKQYSQHETEYLRNDVGLSLNISRGDWQYRDDRSDCSKKDTHISSQIIIDLEESTESETRNVRDSSVDAPACSRDNQVSQVSMQASWSFANSNSIHVPEGNTDTLRNNLPRQGIKRCYDDSQCKNGKENMSKCHTWEQLDLNKIPLDEPPLQWNDPNAEDNSRGNLALPSHALAAECQEGISRSASGWRKQDGSNSDQTSSLLQQDFATSSIMDSESKPNGQIIHGSLMYPILLDESVPEMSLGSQKDSYSYSGNSKFMDAPVLSNENHKDVAMQKSSSVMLKDAVSSNLSYRGNTVEDSGSESSPTSCKTDHLVEKFANSNTDQVGNDLDVNKNSHQDVFQNIESPGGAKSSLEQESAPYMVSDENTQCRVERNEESSEFDITVQKGAVSLVCFLLECSSGVQETNKTENVKEPQPQCSSDSFESIVLKLRESNVDDTCVSSKVYEVDETSKRDCGIKLRRGRRIKDFQKDILPHLASLSSQEICEDMKIMRGALRSREYKRLRSKMNNEQVGSVPVRNRRSKRRK